MNMELSSSAIVENTKRCLIIIIYLSDVQCSQLIYDYYYKSQYNYTKICCLCAEV